MTTVRYATARGDLSVTKTGPTTPVAVGSTISYTITVRNTGDDVVFASLRDVLPNGLEFVSLTTPNGWAYSTPAEGSNGAVTAAARNLRASDGDQVFTLTVVVQATFFLVSHGANSVTVSSATLDYNAANDAATFTIVPPAPPCVESPADLVSWWQAEGNTADFEDGNHGSPTGAVAYAVGKVGQAFSLDGGSYVSVPSAANLDFTNTLTIEGWINLSTNNFNNGLVFKGDLNGSQGVYSLGFYTGGSNQLTFRLNGGSGQVVGATSLLVGEWYHVAAVYDQVSARIYVNGVQDGSTTYTAAIGTNNAPLIIGGYYSDGHLFRGLIDEPSVYNRALTAQNIESLFAAGTSGKCTNSPPVAVADNYNVNEDPAAPGFSVAAPGVLGNDTDAEMDSLTAVLVSGPMNGSLALNANGSFLYTPAANFNGTDSFHYQANDGEVNSPTTTVTITVTEVNDAPTADDDTTTVTEDGSVTITVLTNDATGPADESNQSLTVIAVTALHGSVIINANWTLSYLPAANYNGPDTISYTIQDNGTTNGLADPLSAIGNVDVTVTEVNDVPTAGTDSATVPEDGSVVINVLGNDSTGPGNESNQSLTVKTASALHGTVSINGDGTLTYAPAPNFIGPDTISYTIQDNGTTNGAADPQTATGTVSITVNPNNQGAPGKITGGGSIDSGVRNFGFVVQPASGGGFKGNLEFQDKSPAYNFNLKSTAVTSILVAPGQVHGSFEGIGKLNGAAGYTFRVDVEDKAEPGAGVDKFRIRISGPGGFSYDSQTVATKGGILDKGGNIQVHKAGSKLSSVATDGGSTVLVSSAGQILAGLLSVSVQDDGESIAADQQARIDDAMTTLNNALSSLGLTLILVDGTHGESADVSLEMAWTSACGSAADGVLGCTTPTGEITILKGWNWYTGAESSGVVAQQYDYQTIVTHELGHSVGLDHSGRANSVMYASLASGVARRTLAAGDITVESEEESGPAALLAVQVPIVSASMPTQPSFPAAVRHGVVSHEVMQGFPKVGEVGSAPVSPNLGSARNNSDSDILVGQRSSSTNLQSLDLLSAVLHELDHELGFDHDEDIAAMYEKLAVGTRRLL